MPTTNAMITSAANAPPASSRPRHGFCGGGTYTGATLGSSAGGTGCVWSQLQNGQILACSSIERSHRIQGLRLLILFESLQPAYRVGPDVDSSRADAKCLWRN